MSRADALNSVLSLAAEDLARANLYALLARLFYAPPDAALLQSLASAGELQAEDGRLGDTWHALSEAAAKADREAVRDEYDTVFVGTGKAPVTLYACAYSIRYASEAPLAELRGELARLGLARRQDVGEPEDHIAALCDTMRHLIVSERDLATQSAFFRRWIEPAMDHLCDAIEADPRTSFYNAVGRFARTYFHIERSGFEML